MNPDPKVTEHRARVVAAMKLLKPFCHHDPERRPSQAMPFTQGEWTYAVDGYIGIRIPALPEIVGHPKALNADQVFSKHGPANSWKPVPEVEIVPARVQCDACRGGGQAHCRHCQHWNPCKTCDGTGMVFNKACVVFDGLNVPIRILNKISGLPGVEIGVTTDSVVRFRFDGGEGIFSPICEVEKED